MRQQHITELFLQRNQAYARPRLSKSAKEREVNKSIAGFGKQFVENDFGTDFGGKRSRVSLACIEK
jgi:hypothetical protein